MSAASSVIETTQPAAEESAVLMPKPKPQASVSARGVSIYGKMWMDLRALQQHLKAMRDAGELPTSVSVYLRNDHDLNARAIHAMRAMDNIQSRLQ